MSCQDQTDPRVLHLSPSEGLADRTINSLHIDSSGVVYIKTPLAIQKYRQGEFEGLIKASTIEGEHHLIANENYLFDIDTDDCISIIDKNDFRKKSNVCLDSLLEERPILLDAQDDHAWVLLPAPGSAYSISKLSFIEDQIVVSEFEDFEFDGTIRAFGVDEKQELHFLIDDQDGFYVFQDENLIYEASDCVPASVARDPEIFVDRYSSITYYSLVGCVGIHSWSKEGGYERVTEKGFIEFANQDDLGQVLIGVTDSRALHVDSLIFLGQHGVSSSFAKVKEENDRIIQVYGPNFSESLLSATHNGIYSFDFIPDGIDLFLHDASLGESDFGALVRGFSKSEKEGTLIIKEGGNDVFELRDGDIKVRDDLSIYIGYGTVWIDYSEEEGVIRILQYSRSGSSTFHDFDLANNSNRQVELPFTAEKFHAEDGSVYITGRKGNAGIIARLSRKREVELLFEGLLTDRHVRASYFDSDRYFFGTHDGLLIWDKTSDEEGVQELLSGYSITYVKRFKSKILVGTYNQGMFWMNEDLDIQAHINLNSSSAGNTVASIEQDVYGNYWISTFGGIVVMDDELKKITSLDYSHGIGSIEFNRSASLKMPTGDLLFGSLNGFVKIDPEVFFSSSHFAPISLVNAVAKSGSYLYNLEQDNGRYEVIGVPDEIELLFNEEAFGVKQDDSILQYYDLSVEPTAQVDIRENGKLTLADIGLGGYAIYLKRRLPNSERVLVAQFDVIRDYRSALRDVMILLAGVLLSSFFIYRVLLHRQKARDLKLNLRNEINELRLKGLRAQLNPHFIFNALNSIQFYVQDNDKLKARDYLNKFSRLIRLILESSHYDEVLLDKEIEHIRLYLDLEKMRFNNKWDYKISVSEDLDHNDFRIPAMLVQPLVENAILHGVRYLKERRGEIVVRFDLEGELLKVVVEDNGVGMVKAREIKSLKDQNHTSLSTNITNSRLQVLNFNGTERYSIKYDSNRGQDGESYGTIVNLHMKTSTAYGAA